MRIFHVYRSKQRKTVRCGSMMLETALTSDAAKDPWFWREGSEFTDVVICIRCAGHRIPCERITPYAN